jgi:endonuclease/exonuclease/phosphatase family metal-dependent hydrolase
MGRVRLLALCGTLVFAAGCSDTSPVGPSATSNGAKDNGLLTNEAWYGGAGPGAMPIRIYQQNVYPGFDIDSVAAGLVQSLISSDPTPFFDSLAVGMATFDSTNWRERAARMVLEIQRQNPDVVSLNEMITLDRKGLGLIGINVADGKTDFLGIFEEELANRGLHYKLVDSLPLTDAFVPIDVIFLGLPFGTVYARYQDRDAMLVREDVGVANVATDTFDVFLDQVLPQLRGWIAADLTVRGKTWRFVTTHPDPSWPANGKTPHVEQLIASVANVTSPVIIAGDLNLQPTWTEHQQLVDAGFVDLWTRRLGPAPSDNPNGFTCCELDPALRNPQPTLTKRIDYVMARSAAGYGVGPVRFSIFGDDPAERTATGMWPADHAGLLVGLVMQHQ